MTPALPRELARAPLPAVALALTAGILLSRFAHAPFWPSVLAGVGCLAAFAATRKPAPLLCSVACLGAALHASGNMVAPDDIAWRAGPRVVPAVLRGTLDDEPRRLPAGKPDPLLSQPEPASANAVLALASLITPDGEEPISGRVRLLVNAEPDQSAESLLPGLHPGDAVEVAGRLEAIRPPGNPGEFSRAAYWETQGIRAALRARPGAARKL
ncbi:MAG: DUF4131 domain-containing protein, partial [Gemmataceae bacterium]|nr:DUF4131 domain-containing protein [Gemmataceae bacterium]